MAVGNRLTKAGKHVDAAWGLVSKGGLLALVSVVLVVVIVEVARECLSDTIVMEPVIIKGSVGGGGPTVEMATQQIATYMDKIQRSVPIELRPLAFSAGEPTISIQIPGSSINVESVVREIAGLFPQRRRVLKVSIAANPSGAGYVAAVSISHKGSQKRQTCETDNKPGELGTMFECIAVEAMKIIDPLYAASYALSVEAKRCARFQPEPPPPTDPVSEKKRLLQVLRDYCSFAGTRSLVSTIIDRGGTDDQPWVSYIYGILHLARADAVAKVDTEAEWYEFDLAIKRFEQFGRDKTIQMEAYLLRMEVYIKSGVSIQENVGTLDWKTHKDFIRYRLDVAKDILVKARWGLDHDVDSRPGATPRLRTAVAAGMAPVLPVHENRNAAWISHLHGLILYRQWMIQTRWRYPNGEFGFAHDAEEGTQLREALKHFEIASHQFKQPYEFYIEWGNTLRALRRFDDAVEKYRQASDIAPDTSIPPLSIAVALLEKSKESYRAQDEHRMEHEHRTEHLFEALRQTSSYLTWVSDGGPYTTFVDRITEVLGEVGDGSVAEDFAFCRGSLSFHEADPKVADLSHTAALKYCVDQASDAVSGRVMDEDKARKATEQRTRTANEQSTWKANEQRTR
jgi:tetratricopeptide (TPR) repeat protein